MFVDDAVPGKFADAVFCIFDGHAGKLSATKCAEQLPMTSIWSEIPWNGTWENAARNSGSEIRSLCLKDKASRIYV